MVCITYIYSGVRTTAYNFKMTRGPLLGSYVGVCMYALWYQHLSLVIVLSLTHNIQHTVLVKLTGPPVVDIACPARGQTRKSRDREKEIAAGIIIIVVPYKPCHTPHTIIRN